ncbi:YpoC family protein [Bacillus sinesaloumensis]|uniref:YpoC family protein n=1 Tax=Litchfieldia sinesaloumensis TaxID=1926280 RepID=UPI0009888288|nr:hypothetical protein [Bacillus sinesaloumensis]
MSDIREKWDVRNEYLISLFKNREKAAIKAPMNEAIDDFLTVLFLVNEKDNPSLKEFQKVSNSLSCKPINLDERFQFILKKPHQYHSFVQLNELYQELLKIYAKMKILKNKK